MNKKNVLKNIFLFLILLFGMAIFPSIPLKIFNIPYDKFSITMKVIYNFFCDIGFIIIVFLIYKERLINDFKKYFNKFKDNFETSFKYYFIGAIIMIVSNLIIVFFFKDANAGNEEAVRDLIGEAPLYMLFSVSIYAPLIEELIFRHTIKNCVPIKKNNKFLKYLYAFISGFIFALLHIIGQANGVIDYIYIIPYMSLGFAFALLYYDTDNIFSSIMMHCFHNTVTIILYFMSGGIV